MHKLLEIPVTHSQAGTYGPGSGMYTCHCWGQRMLLPMRHEAPVLTNKLGVQFATKFRPATCEGCQQKKHTFIHAGAWCIAALPLLSGLPAHVITRSCWKSCTLPKSYSHIQLGVGTFCSLPITPDLRSQYSTATVATTTAVVTASRLSPCAASGRRLTGRAQESTSV